MADRGRHLPHVHGRLARHHDPRGRAQPLRQRLQLDEREPDGRRQGRRRPRESQAKARRQSAQLAMLVRESKRLGRPRDVEQQRVRHDHEEDVDQISACDHKWTWSWAKACTSMGTEESKRKPMSESDPKLSAHDGDSAVRRSYLRTGIVGDDARAPRVQSHRSRPRLAACSSTRFARARSRACHGLATLLALADSSARDRGTLVVSTARRARAGTLRSADDRRSRAAWTRASSPATISSRTRTAPGSGLPRSLRARIAGMRATRSRSSRAIVSRSCSTTRAHAPSGSTPRKVADYRAAYMNESSHRGEGARSDQTAAGQHRSHSRQGVAHVECSAPGFAPMSIRSTGASTTPRTCWDCPWRKASMGRRTTSRSSCRAGSGCRIARTT